LTVLNSFLKQSFLVSTNVTSALEVFLNDMRYINSRFTLLTYSSSRPCVPLLRVSTYRSKLNTLEMHMCIWRLQPKVKWVT